MESISESPHLASSAWWWQRALDAAHRLGARHEAGLIHLERGRRTGAREDLECAERLFAEIGGRLGQAQARALLAGPIA